jgi:hypothetical protein
MKPQYLRITGVLILVSFLFFIVYSNKNVYEIMLSTCLLLTFLSTQMFWNDPIKGSLIHRFDSITSKATITSFIVYTVIKKITTIFLGFSYFIALFIMLYYFYLSNYYSMNLWCCDEHIYYHGLAHIFCFISSLFAFL